MKKTFATIVALAALSCASWAQGQLKATMESCNTIQVSFTPDKSTPDTDNHLIFWLERQLAPGIWSVQAKKYTSKNTVVFGLLGPGIYRVVGMGNAPEFIARDEQPEMLESIAPSAVIEVKNCARDRAEESRQTTFGMDAISLYPNPANNILHLFIGKGDLTEETSLELSDIMGKKMIAENVTGLQQSVDVSHLPPGTYVATIRQGKIPVFRKEVVILNHP